MTRQSSGVSPSRQRGEAVREEAEATEGTEGTEEECYLILDTRYLKRGREYRVTSIQYLVPPWPLCPLWLDRSRVHLHTRRICCFTAAPWRAWRPWRFHRASPSARLLEHESLDTIGSQSR